MQRRTFLDNIKNGIDQNLSTIYSYKNSDSKVFKDKSLSSPEVQ